MAEILDDYEPNPTAPDTGGFNPSFQSSLHLPKINLPTFDFRSFDKWENFRDRFKLMIFDDSLTNIDRMHYLFSCFTGEVTLLPTSRLSISLSRGIRSFPDTKINIV